MRRPWRGVIRFLVYAFILAAFDHDALAQCVPDPNSLFAACPAPGPIEAPPPGPCAMDSLMFTSKTMLTWIFPLGCPFLPCFDVARGDLECLLSGVRVSEACDVCLPGEAASCIDAVATDIDEPLPGEAYWYLVRVNATSWNELGFGNLTNYNPIFPDITGCPP